MADVESFLRVLVAELCAEVLWGALAELLFEVVVVEEVVVWEDVVVEVRVEVLWDAVEEEVWCWVSLRWDVAAGVGIDVWVVAVLGCEGTVVVVVEVVVVVMVVEWDRVAGLCEELLW